METPQLQAALFPMIHAADETLDWLLFDFSVIVCVHILYFSKIWKMIQILFLPSLMITVLLKDSGPSKL